MSQLLKQLVEKARGTVKTEGELQEGQGRREYKFSDGFKTDVFEGGDDYTPESPKGWNGYIPEEGGMANHLRNAVDRNKNN